MARYRVSRSKAREYASKMNEINTFCSEHGIQQSRTSDSYYFRINGRPYRVSNHTIAASNAHAYNALGEQIRDKYHDDAEDPNTVYITAGKTRIMEIYMDLTAGYELDRRGNRK